MMLSYSTGSGACAGVRVPGRVAPPGAGVARRRLVHVAAAAHRARRPLGGGPVVLPERPHAHVVLAAGGCLAGPGEVLVAGAAVVRP